MFGMGDANNNSARHSFFAQVKKCYRVDSEQEKTNPAESLEADNNVSTQRQITILTRPNSSLTQQNLTVLNVLVNNGLESETGNSSDGNNTSRNELQTESMETVINNRGYVNRERENLAFCLDKLNDKNCRYESHENFLKKCLDNNLVPNGIC